MLNNNTSVSSDLGASAGLAFNIMTVLAQNKCVYKCILWGLTAFQARRQLGSVDVCRLPNRCDGRLITDRNFKSFLTFITLAVRAVSKGALGKTERSRDHWVNARRVRSDPQKVYSAHNMATHGLPTQRIGIRSTIIARSMGIRGAFDSAITCDNCCVFRTHAKISYVCRQAVKPGCKTGRAPAFAVGVETCLLQKFPVQRRRLHSS